MFFRRCDEARSPSGILLLRNHKSVSGRVDANGIALREISAKDTPGERVFDLLLDEPFERPRTVGGVEAGLREQLLGATYRPQPVRRVEISKPDGGVRKLDIPTVLDRLIQQAILQVLTAVWEPTFSTHRYGFRPGRSAHQAVTAAQACIAAGRTWVVDLDLSRPAGIRSGEP